MSRRHDLQHWASLLSRQQQQQQQQQQQRERNFMAQSQRLSGPVISASAATLTMLEMTGKTAFARWDTADTTFVSISQDKLTVRYAGQGRHAHDVGAVVANAPLRDLHFNDALGVGQSSASEPADGLAKEPNREELVAYFEVQIVDAGATGNICVGLTRRGFVRNRQPGWEEGSFGFLGESGFKFNASMAGEEYASEGFGAGDVVGCGIYFPEGEIFFTKNGRDLGVAFSGVDVSEENPLFPTVGLHSPGETITANFGQRPFKWDVLGLIEKRRASIMSKINEVAHTVPAGQIHALIRDYLAHHGYGATLAAFEHAAGSTSLSRAGPTGAAQSAKIASQKSEMLALRQKLRQQIQSGNIIEAEQVLNERCPGIMDRNPRVGFALRVQAFIELVRAGDVTSAITLAQQELAVYDRSETDNQDHLISSDNRLSLRDAMGLLAYPNPHQSPFAHYLDETTRRDVADIVNEALLEEEASMNSEEPHKGTGQQQQSILDRILRHLLVKLRMNFGEQSGLPRLLVGASLPHSFDPPGPSVFDAQSSAAEGELSYSAMED